MIKEEQARRSLLSCLPVTHLLGYLCCLQKMIANNYWQFFYFFSFFLTVPTLWFSGLSLAATEVGSPKPHPLWAVILSTFFTHKPCNWVAISLLDKTEPGYPSDSQIHHFCCHICISVDSCPFSLTVSQLPSRDLLFPILSLTSAPIAGPITSAQLLFQLSSWLPGPAISWATLVIPFQFRLHSIYCVFSHWIQSFCIKTHKPEMLGNRASA